MENTFLKNYEMPKDQPKYMKFKKWINKFRVLSPAITGWVDWKNEGEKKTPIRTTEKPKIDIDPTKPARHFRAMIVWNYENECIQILEITQKKILQSLYAYVESSDRGSPLLYDIQIEKKGDGMQTEYITAPLPPKPLAKEISLEYQAKKIDLQKLFSWEDPFISEERF